MSSSAAAACVVLALPSLAAGRAVAIDEGQSPKKLPFRPPRRQEVEPPEVSTFLSNEDPFSNEASAYESYKYKAQSLRVQPARRYQRPSCRRPGRQSRRRDRCPSPSLTCRDASARTCGRAARCCNHNRRVVNLMSGAQLVTTTSGSVDKQPVSVSRSRCRRKP